MVQPGQQKTDAPGSENDKNNERQQWDVKSLEKDYFYWNVSCLFYTEHAAAKPTDTRSCWDQIKHQIKETILNKWPKPR